MRSFLVLLLVGCAAKAYPTDNDQSYLVCRDTRTGRCSMWMWSQLGEAGTMDVLEQELIKGQFCGWTKDGPQATYIKIKTLRSETRKLRCFDTVYHEYREDAPDDVQRSKRQAPYRHRGYRGQTQSQYLNIDGGKDTSDGKAEASSSVDGSSAIVSEFQ